ncbi:23S rRNA (cytidine(2498)-2'-O)-methyltransferase RlmM [Methyloterricola oryzae]|uniref:23S rRNA (cytidine(2498)-2'-O)-methyltransferase RlmM n=1 Tax=Methyloterricola oryzae TaxID=1495050 RepID=UPI000A894530|nr:23S rRNA (cytidine(2498)-2'-O)-methyltransferase RlmM [Methyloterricola oryzae]
MTQPRPNPPELLLLYCRAGFEKECAAEIQNRARALHIEGFCKTSDKSGYVLFSPYDTAQVSTLGEELRFADLIFPRQWVFALPLISQLPVTDRITPLLSAARSLGGPFSDILLETADTNEAKELSVFVRKFSTPFGAAAQAAGLAGGRQSAPRLHIFFLDSSNAYVGLSHPGNASPWPMGIPRLKFPRSAPSRSTLKLEEAFLTFLGPNHKALQPGMRAVDLGAAPGGWTWQLVRRSIRVTAIDNGPMDPALLESGIVEHLRVDGFRYLPPKPVDWLVCDMVEQPARIAALAARWLAGRHCRYAIFNLKLPMKKRYDEVRACLERIAESLDAAEVPFRLRARQLYHDREEITVYAERLGSR